MCIRTKEAPIYIIICSLRFSGGWEEEVNKIILQFSWKNFIYIIGNWQEIYLLLLFFFWGEAWKCWGLVLSGIKIYFPTVIITLCSSITRRDGQKRRAESWSRSGGRSTWAWVHYVIKVQLKLEASKRPPGNATVSDFISDAKRGGISFPSEHGGLLPARDWLKAINMSFAPTVSPTSYQPLSCLVFKESGQSHIHSKKCSIPSPW